MPPALVCMCDYSSSRIYVCRIHLKPALMMAFANIHNFHYIKTAWRTKLTVLGDRGVILHLNRPGMLITSIRKQWRDSLRVFSQDSPSKVEMGCDLWVFRRRRYIEGSQKGAQ